MANHEPINSSQTLAYLTSLTPIIENFCEPLKDLKINFFTYSRLYEKGKGIFLCNNDQWYVTKFENDLFDSEGFVTVSQLYREEFTRSIFTGLPSKEIKIFQFLYDLNFWNSIDLYIYGEEYKEVFHFASTRENIAILNFFINNTSFLEKFCYFFKEKISKIILEAPNDIYIDVRAPLNPIIIQDRQELLLQTKDRVSKKVPLLIDGQWVTFSKRQIQCLSLLIKGQTAKEIGLFLNISYRTVECYLDILKIKLGCHTRREIIDLLCRNDAERQLFFTSPEREIS